MIGDIVDKDKAHLELIPAKDIDALPEVLRRERVDWVIAEIDAMDIPPVLIEAHRAQPDLRILGVVKGTKDAHVIDMHPQHLEAGELGVDRLRQLLTDSAGIKIGLATDVKRTP